MNTYSSIATSITSILVLSTSSIHSQNVSINGVVTDTNGAPIYSARIMLSNIAIATSSKPNGEWSFGAVSSIQPRPNKHHKEYYLATDGSRLLIRYSDRMIDGRHASPYLSRINHSTHNSEIDQINADIETAQRNASNVIDTIIVYWNSMPRKRIPISSYAERISIKIDTTQHQNDIPWNSKVKYGYIQDERDGQIYRTVDFGTMTWMAENLNFNESTSWSSGITNDSAGKTGRRYRWATAMGIGDEYESIKWTGDSSKQTGICPIGWRIPTFTDWRALDNWITSKTIEVYTGNNKNGTKIKSTNGWNALGSNPGNGTDIYGMRITPEPGGFGANYITSSNSSKYIWSFSLNYGMSWIDSSSSASKTNVERPLRCIKQ